MGVFYLLPASEDCCARGGRKDFGTERMHERRRPEEAVAAAEATVGAGEDEAEEEGVGLRP